MVVVPKTRAKATTIFGAINPYDVKEISLVVLWWHLKKKQNVAQLLDIILTLLLAVCLSWIAILNLKTITL